MPEILWPILVVSVAFFIARYFGGMGIGAPWLPVRRQDMDAAFRLVEIGPDDVVVDLGSGDGRLLVESAKRGARVVGYELNPFMVWLSRSRLTPHASRFMVFRKNLLEADLSEATVIFIFGMGHIMPKVAEKMRREAKPDVRIVSFAFQIPDWDHVKKDGIAFLYTLPTRD